MPQLAPAAAAVARVDDETRFGRAGGFGCAALSFVAGALRSRPGDCGVAENFFHPSVVLKSSWEVCVGEFSRCAWH